MRDLSKWQCPHCPCDKHPRDFWGTSKANLNQHLMGTHNMDADGNPKVLNCPHCTLTFNRYDKRKRHVERVHGSASAPQSEA